MTRSAKKRHATGRTDPLMWDRVVATVKAGTKGGAAKKWSARKAQLAVRMYKRSGGGYTSRRKPNSSLGRWTKQDWGYVDPSDARAPRSKRGRYLPKSVRRRLTSKQKRETNKKKRSATNSGRSRAPYGPVVLRLTRKLNE